MPEAGKLPVIISSDNGLVERYQCLIFARKKLPFLPINAMDLRANFPFEEAFLASAGGSYGLGSD